MWGDKVVYTLTSTPDFYEEAYNTDTERQINSQTEKETTMSSGYNTIKAVRERKFIVGSIAEDGSMSFRPYPYIHLTEESANKEAERLANIYVGNTFVCVQFKGGVRASVVERL